MKGVTVLDPDFDFSEDIAASHKASRGKVTVQDTLGLKDVNQKHKLSPNTIKLNEIDRDIYHDCVDRYDAMEQNLQDGLKEYSPFDNLSEDIFNSLFKYNVNMHDVDDVQAKSQLNHKLMENLLESDEYNNLRSATKFDLMSSAIGTEVLQGKAMEQIMQYKQAYQQKMQTGQNVPGADAGELIETLNKMSSTQSQIDALESLAGSGQKLTKKQAMELAALKQDYQDLVLEYENNHAGQTQMQNGMTQAVNQGAKDAAIQVGEVQDIIEAWGLGEGSHNRKISLDQRKKAIERVRRSSRLKDLTDLIGRFRALALKKKKKPIPDGHNIKTITTGNKLENILPSELMNLANPATKKDFMRRYTQKQLLVYEKNDSKTIGQGPIIFCQDKSGSTHGTIDDWATALALATVEVAQKEKRDFAYIPFEDVVMQTKDIRPGELDPQDVLDIAEMESDGGTNFMRPLERALKVLEDSRYTKADVMFVTDGHAGVSQEFLDRFMKVKAEKNFYVNTILINVGGYAVSRGTVDLFSDNVTTISSVAELDEANAAKMFNLLDDKDKFNGQQPAQGQPQSAVGQVAAQVNGTLDDEEEDEEIDAFGP